MVQTPDDTRIDASLLDRIASRDQAALSELYDRHSRLLFGVVVRILKDRAEAEDALQEVFLAVWNRADTYKASLGSPRGWLVRVARNRGIDRLRAKGVRDQALESRYGPVDDQNPELHAALRQRQRIVARALAALPADQRELIEDAYFLGLTHSELAARFQLPLGTVKTRIRTGMMALRQHLEETMVEP